ncbi:EpsG family protein [Sphingobacterium spiritivorum]|uniref:EpsG family protein n=1 Tax=Sphingobacterium spiritivorum TaxID=258 RepID=UPI003DA54F43
MDIYYIILLIIFFFSTLDGFKGQHYSKLLFYIAIVFLIFFVGIRFQVGNDYNAYYSNYLGINSGGSTDSKEIVYVLLNKILSFEGVIFFFSLLSFYFLARSIRYFNPDYSNTALLIYFSLFLVTFNIHIIRQGLAIAIILYSYKYFFEKKYYIYIALVLLAAGFHLSALIVLPISYFFKFNFKKKTQIILLLSSVIISFNASKLIDLYYTIANNIPVLNKYLVFYRRDESGQYTFSFGMLFDILVLLFLMRKSENFSEKQTFLYKIFYISVILSLLLVVDQAALRLNYYFRVVLILLLPLLIGHFRVRLAVRLGILLACYLYLYMGFTSIGEYGRGDRNLRYKTIIDKH